MRLPSPVRLIRTTVMQGDGARIDQIAAQRPEPRQNAILIHSREPPITDNVRD
jgi:hypothetical protein